MATGEFNGDGDNADVVVGMPRGANLTGKVQFFKKNLLIKNPSFILDSDSFGVN